MHRWKRGREPMFFLGDRILHRRSSNVNLDVLDDDAMLVSDVAVSANVSLNLDQTCTGFLVVQIVQEFLGRFSCDIYFCCAFNRRRSFYGRNQRVVGR